ncbi:nickel-dependent hydrogenase large subunit [Sulfolobus sp. B1]|nr:nickel-dependent hydrogenase large subunit [Sulfolobus sp. B1]
MTNITISPFNRVEGDLDVEVKYEKNKVVDVKFISRLFRGLEIILRNKDPWDALVITPRVCGICGGSHLYSSASALDMIYNAEVPKNAVKIRNVLAMAETCQNDIRHTYLMFLIDSTNRLYEKYEFYPEILKRWTPLVGSSYKEAIRWSKKYT